jgi:hypothetical protein
MTACGCSRRRSTAAATTCARRLPGWRRSRAARPIRSRRSSAPSATELRPRCARVGGARSEPIRTAPARSVRAPR